jgi:SWI/SNF-related matrix-associated actin-dependent regulator of chromatin subfamily A-like protein 1
VAKIPHVIEHLQDALAESAKVVCFAHHREVIHAISAEFGEACAVVYGDTPAPDRQAAVDRLQTDPECRLFVGGITVAGTGITLTASSHIVFAEYDWRPGVMSQAEDRCHRIGQRESLLAQYLVFDGSIDAIMATRNVEKEDIIAAALGDATADKAA